MRSAVVVLLLLTGLVATACTVRQGSNDLEAVVVTVMVTDLRNPRGVFLDSEGGLLVAEAGLGDDPADVTDRTGRLTRYIDRNGDGDFDDPGEIEPWFEHLASYNAMNVYATGRDEVSGPSDTSVHDDGRVFLSVDGGFEEFALLEISPEGSIGRDLSGRSNMTGLALSLDGRFLFATESTLNQLVEISLESGVRREIVAFATLSSGQQSVPAGIAIDPLTGDVLVALFSGVALDEGGSYIPFVIGDAKVVRVNPASGRVVTEISGLTTAVDVAVDDLGNVFVVEMAADYAGLFDRGTDLSDPNLPVREGGYVRFSGKVTVHPYDGSPPRVLAEGLDAPTNITFGRDGALYVSLGQGTPGRRIPGPYGETVIVGEILRITGF